MRRSWHLALGKRLKERRVRGVGEGANDPFITRHRRSLVYLVSRLSFPRGLRLFRYCRAREYGTRSFIIARVTNRFFPAIDIDGISELLHLRRRRVSLITFSVMRLQVVWLDIYEHVYRDKYQIKRAYGSQTS